MKTKVLKYNLVGRSQVFIVSLLALLRKTGLAGEETSGAIPAEVLDTLKIQLVSPNVTGAQILTTKLTRPCHYSVEGNELTIALGELTPGKHRLTVKSVYGTNTRSLLIIDATVPVGAGETGEAISVDVAAVSTFSDENNADGRIFQSDEDGNAKIASDTLSIGGGNATGDNAVAEGVNTIASGNNSHAEGDSTTASGNESHAEGNNTTASGYASHAEGDSTTASGDESHAEGDSTTASGNESHAEGVSTTASGNASHAEGDNTTASGYASHAEGASTTASGDQSHAEGYGTKAISNYSHAEGCAEWGNPYEVTVRPLTEQEKQEIAAKVGNVHPDYICEDDEIADGQAPVLYADEECTEMVARIMWSKYSDTWHGGLSGDFFQIMGGTLAAGTYWARFEPAASGYASHAEGNNTIASGDRSHAEGANTTASGNQSHADGENTIASGDRSHAEGENTIAIGNQSHAEGDNTTAIGNQSHAEGDNTTAIGNASHAEGANTTASGNRSHAEGVDTTARGGRSHAEGVNTTTSGYASHAEGGDTTARGDVSHAEGWTTTTSGYASHAEGGNTTASGDRSHAEGLGTVAASQDQHVSGRYNVEDSGGEYALIVGNGTGNNARSNAFAIDWSGNLVLFNNGTPVVLTPAKLAQLIA